MRAPRVDLTLLLAVILGSGPALAAPFAWIPKGVGTNTVAVIDIDTDTVAWTVTVGADPLGVAVTDGGTTVYVTNAGDGTVSVIDATVEPPSVTNTIPVGARPIGIALDQRRARLFVADQGTNPGVVSVIDTATNAVVESFTGVGNAPFGVTALPDGGAVVGSAGFVSVISPMGAVSNLAVSDASPSFPIVDPGRIVGAGPFRAQFDPGQIVVLDQLVPSLLLVDPAGPSGQPLPGVRAVGAAFDQVANHLWVSDEANGAVVAISAPIGPGSRITRSIPVGVQPQGLAFGEAPIDATPSPFPGYKLYVVNRCGADPGCAPGSGTVSVADLDFGNKTRTIAVGGNPVAVGRFISKSANFLENGWECAGRSWKVGPPPEIERGCRLGMGVQEWECLAPVVFAFARCTVAKAIEEIRAGCHPTPANVTRALTAQLAAMRPLLRDQEFGWILDVRHLGRRYRRVRRRLEMLDGHASRLLLKGRIAASCRSAVADAVIQLQGSSLWTGHE
jgi:YVTN family beta-propeller protein